MNKDTFLYFAYGSNMLAQRLLDRCPSAKSLGKAIVKSYELSFGILGKDGSGKVVIVPSDDVEDEVQGVVYEINSDELQLLDEAEANYQRDDAFIVNLNGEESKVHTYYIAKKDCIIGLIPMDWYRDICIAGAKEHGIDGDYIKRFEALTCKSDPDNPANKYL